MWDKPRVIDILAPILYEHLCKTNGLNSVDKLGCVENIEYFAQIQILPKPKTVFYTRETLGENYGSTTGINLMQQQIIVENSAIDQERIKIMSEFSGDQAMNLIKSTLDNKISIGVKEKNYLGYFENDTFLSEFSGLDLPYVTIENKHYIYVVPARVGNIVAARQQIADILMKYGYAYSDQQISNLFTQQENRYVKLGEGLNATLAKKINDLINENYSIKSSCDKQGNGCVSGIPLLHGVGMEKAETRYYPYGNFAANVLGFYTKDGYALYGIEQYFDQILKGKAGEIRGLSTPLL